jgi:hypothetical protein
MIDPFQQSTCSLNTLIAINRTVFKRFKAPLHVLSMERETSRKLSGGRETEWLLVGWETSLIVNFLSTNHVTNNLLAILVMLSVL